MPVVAKLEARGSGLVILLVILVPVFATKDDGEDFVSECQEPENALGILLLAVLSLIFSATKPVNRECLVRVALDGVFLLGAGGCPVLE